MTVLSPRTYNLPHDEWRPGQHEAINVAVTRPEEYVLIQAETGAGKSAIGMGLGSRGRTVRYVTFTKALQRQAAKYPGAEEIFGLDAYPCAFAGKPFRASTCAFIENMAQCPVANECEYLQRRAAVKEATRQALSYQYLLAASWPGRNPTDILFCDEAHELPSLIMDYMSLEIRADFLSKNRLPALPHMPPIQRSRRRVVENWLRGVSNMLDEHIKDIANRDFIPERLRSKKLAMFKYKRRIDDILFGLGFDSAPFYIEYDPSVPMVRVYPLSAAPFFKTLFGAEGKKVLSSATLGRMSVFAAQLGLKKGEYYAHAVPPAFKPYQRPVHYYKDGPSLSFDSPDSVYEWQKERVIEASEMFDPSAYGLLHFSSKAAAYDMAERLSSHLGHRIWIPPEKESTEGKLAAWEEQKRRVPGTVALAYSFHTGVDAPDVSFNLGMKVAYRPLDERGKAVLDGNPQLYQWEAANKVEQLSGRTRRGELAHYEVPGEPVNKFVAMLDTNFLKLKKYFSRTFNLSLKAI